MSANLHRKTAALTTAIISYMKPGEERGDALCAGLRVRCLTSGQKAFFYRYRARDGALREIKLDQGRASDARRRATPLSGSRWSVTRA